MKKAYLIFFILITLFIFNTKASAITCKYKTVYSYDAAADAEYSYDVETESKDSNKPEPLERTISFSQGDMEQKKVDGFKILNWKEDANKYYKNVQPSLMAGICPQYLIMFETDRFVTYEKDLNAVKTTVNKYIKEYTGSENIKISHNILKLTNPFNNTPTEEDTPSSCLAFKEKDCTTNKYFSCLWIEKGEYKYCSSNNLLYVTCGDIKDIPEQVPRIMSFIINLLKIVVPILLVLVSIINILKALASSKEDEIKKAQSTLIKKIIAAVMAFLVVSIVQFVINKVADSDEEKGNIASCLDCFLNNNCSSNIYYKNNVAGTDYCAYLGEDEAYNCNNNGDSLTIGDWGKNKIKHRTTGEQE